MDPALRPFVVVTRLYQGSCWAGFHTDGQLYFTLASLFFALTLFDNLKNSETVMETLWIIKLFSSSMFEGSYEQPTISAQREFSPIVDSNPLNSSASAWGSGTKTFLYFPVLYNFARAQWIFFSSGLALPSASGWYSRKKGNMHKQYHDREWNWKKNHSSNGFFFSLAE